MTTTPLTVLDLMPISSGSSAPAALRNSAALARNAEEFGYARYWMAEHHFNSGVAGTSPAVALAAVASYRTAFRPSAELDQPYVSVSADVVVAKTEAAARASAAAYGLWVRAIRTGQGAVPFPAPEQTRAHVWSDTDQRLVADRVDTQFVGTAAQVADQLEQLRDAADADELIVTTITHDHADRVRSYELLADEWRQRRLLSVPVRSTVAEENQPPMTLLGSSPASARLAGSLGLPYAYAHDINALATVESLDAYRSSFRPSTCSSRPYAVLAALVFADDTDAAARELAAPFLAGQVHMRAGNLDALFPTPAQAEDFVFTPAQREWADDRLDRQLWGSLSRIRGQLTELFGATGADELMAVTVIHDHARRIRSHELLMAALGPSSPDRDHLDSIGA